MNVLWSLLHQALWDDTFLVAPTLSILVNALLASLLSLIRIERIIDDPATLVEQGLRSLNLVSTASITIVTLTFSLTVLSVQIAAGNYSARLLEDFLKEPTAKIVISVNLGAYAYCFVLSLFIKSDSSQSNVPVVSLFGLSVHMLAILISFVHFIHFFLHEMRLEQILNRAAFSSLRAAKALRSAASSTRNSKRPGQRRRQPLPDVPSHAYKVLADKSGYVTQFKLDSMVQLASQLDICVRFRHQIGEFVCKGTILCYVWDTRTSKSQTSQQPSLSERVYLLNRDEKKTHNSTLLEPKKVEEKLGSWAMQGIKISPRRDSDFDVTLGLQQLVDVAVRALSAAVNDPQTAVQAMDAITSVLVELARMDLLLGVPHVYDAKDHLRLCAPSRSFNYLLSMLEPIRRYGAQDLTVCRRGFRLTGDLAAVLAREGRKHRIPAVLAHLEEWMRVAKEEASFAQSELRSLTQLYTHILESVAECDATLLGERNIKDFEHYDMTQWSNESKQEDITTHV